MSTAQSSCRNDKKSIALPYRFRYGRAISIGYRPKIRFRTSLSAPQQTMTRIGPRLNFRSATNAAANRASPTQSTFSSPIPPPLKATNFYMDSPADAISATTAGRRLASTLCSADICL